jgi:hypothetical protein
VEVGLEQRGEPGAILGRSGEVVVFQLTEPKWTEFD